MKIFHFIHSLRNGGAERILVDLAIKQSKLENDVMIYTILNNNVFKDELKKNDISQKQLTSKKRLMFLPSLPFLMYKLHKAVEKFQPDIIHCHLRTDSIVCNIINNYPILRTIQNSRVFSLSIFSIPNKINIFLEKRFFMKKNVSVISCNEFSKNIFNSYFKNKPCLGVINNGINLKRIKYYRKSNVKSENIIITIGTLYDIKNHKMSILAINELLKLNIKCKLFIIGDGIEKNNLENLSKKLKISEKINFIGRVKDINKYLKESSLYWSTSNSEGFSIANIEAIAAGVPAILTNIEGNAEMFKNWNSHLVEIGDYKSLAKLSSVILNDPNLLNDTSIKMREFAVNNYSIDRVEEDYRKCYKQVIDNF